MIPEFRDDGPEFIDFFAGCGGFSLGLREAGWRLVRAINHWAPAIRSHQINFVDAEHERADLNVYDMRRLRRAKVLVGSPICTEASPSGANSGYRRLRQIEGQLALEVEEAPVGQAGYERTRATFFDFVRAAETWRFLAVLMENVPDVAWKWGLFEWFLRGMLLLGYNLQIVCVSAAHIGGAGNLHAPQWRDRMFLIFTREGVPLPDVAPRPEAWCARCGHVVRAVQWWNPRTRRFLGHYIGKYGVQYEYRCPAGHGKVEPYVRPAASIIEWNKPGRRLGDGKMPVPETLRRIREGLELLREPSLITVNHGADADHRALPVLSSPLPTRTTKIGEGIAVPPGYALPGAIPAFIAEMRTHQGSRRVSEPVTTVATSGRHHYLGAVDDCGQIEVDERALVVPYRRTGKLGPLGEPEREPIAIEDVRWRMLTLLEHRRTQRLPDWYELTGTLDEQRMQVGNAVPVNVGHWLGRQVMQVL